jgi:cell division protein FtsB
MNAYELADELQDLHGLYCEDAANMLRQQADRIAELENELKHYKNKAEYLDKRELELLAEVKELHKIAQVMAMQESDARKSLNFSKARIVKYEQVLHSIANDYHELSDHKIEVQVRNHKKWAREALE